MQEDGSGEGECGRDHEGGGGFGSEYSPFVVAAPFVVAEAVRVRVGLRVRGVEKVRVSVRVVKVVEMNTQLTLRGS